MNSVIVIFLLHMLWLPLLFILLIGIAMLLKIDWQPEFGIHVLAMLMIGFCHGKH